MSQVRREDFAKTEKGRSWFQEEAKSASGWMKEVGQRTVNQRSKDSKEKKKYSEVMVRQKPVEIVHARNKECVGGFEKSFPSIQKHR